MRPRTFHRFQSSSGAGSKASLHVVWGGEGGGGDGAGGGGGAMDAGDAWCWQHAVTACAWANKLREVLDALLDAKDAELVRPLAHHLAEYDRANEKVFSALRDIAAMRRLAPPERGQRAAEPVSYTHLTLPTKA